MRAAASLALLALATGSNAQFCFVKEKKCLPGIELSVDYDEVDSLLGITQSSTLSGSATQTASAAFTMLAAVSTFEADTTTSAITTTGATALASTSTGMAGVLGDILRRGTEEIPQAAEYLAPTSSFESVNLPLETGVVPPAYVKPLETVRTSVQHTYALPVPSISTASARLPPSYQVSELLPAPSADLESPRFNLTTTESLPTPLAYTSKVQNHHNSVSHAAEMPSAVGPFTYAPQCQALN